MKTLALTLLITISSLSFAQDNSKQNNNITFKVELEDGINLLKWESNKEVNTSYYQIERSINGGEFEILSTQKAGSSTYQKTSYSYEDVEENAGVNYKITLIMMDGSTVSTLAYPLQEENLAVAIEN